MKIRILVIVLIFSCVFSGCGPQTDKFIDTYLVSACEKTQDENRKTICKIVLTKLGKPNPTRRYMERKYERKVY